MSPGESLLRRVREGLARVDVASEVRRSLPRPPSRFRLVAIGKAAPEMVAGALAAWGTPESAVMVVPDGTTTGKRSIPVLRAAHPVPDARSVAAASRCLQIARECAADGATLLCLVSGGASALVCAPAGGVTLADKRAVTEAMLRSGATIHEVNRVRRRLSGIKNGWLAHAAGDAKVVTRIVSDVVGGTASDVGSGPTVAAVDTPSAVRGLLRRHAPRLAALPVARVPRTKSGDVAIVASPESVARALAGFLQAKRLEPSLASASDLADEYLALARKAKPGAMFVRAAEPSLVVPRRAGRGGRSTHLATLVAGTLPAGAVFLALATDGVDGASGTGGAIVTGGALDDDRAAFEVALRRFDTGTLLRVRGEAIPEAPTGRNFADIHVLRV